MKPFFILLTSILVLTSCSESPVMCLDESGGTLRNIKFSHNLQESNFMTDVDTLKIEILDTNLNDFIKQNKDIYIVKARVYNKENNSNNRLFEYIDPDLRFEINPNNKYEIWIMDLQPTIDSTRTNGGVSRFNYYILDINFSIINPYYLDSHITFFVQSTKE